MYSFVSLAQRSSSDSWQAVNNSIIADNDSIVEKLDAGNILKNELRNTTTLKLYKDNHYRFAYTYRSEKDPKKVLLDLVFTDKDY